MLMAMDGGVTLVLLEEANFQLPLKKGTKNRFTGRGGGEKRYEGMRVFKNT